MEHKPAAGSEDGMQIIVSKNGPYLVSGGVPLMVSEICNDAEGYCRTWKTVRRFPVQQQYSLCRCGHSKNNFITLSAFFFMVLIIISHVTDSSPSLQQS